MARTLTASSVTSRPLYDIPYGVPVGLYPGFYPGAGQFPGVMEFGVHGLYPGFYPGDGEFPGAGDDLLASPITPETLTGAPV